MKLTSLTFILGVALSNIVACGLASGASIQDDFFESAMFYGDRKGDITMGLKSNGGGLSSEMSVVESRRWLITKQLTDGGWASDASEFDGRPQSVYSTALAVLSFSTSNRSGAVLDSYGEHPGFGVDWLLKQQLGSVSRKDVSSVTNVSPFAIVALCEWIFSFDNGSAETMSALENGVASLLRSQRQNGRWCDETESNQVESLWHDYWCYEALMSAKRVGLVSNSIDVCISRYEASMPSKREHENSQSLAMLMVRAIAAHVLLTQHQKTNDIAKIAGLFLQKVTIDGDKPLTREELFLAYIITTDVFQLGGDCWMSWNKSVLTHRLRTQKKHREEGAKAMCWWCYLGEAEGSVEATALSSLMLQSYYRYKRSDRFL